MKRARNHATGPVVIVLFLLASTMTSPARALDGQYQGITEASRVFTGQPNRVLYSGTTAFVALDTGIETYDVADPSNPSLLDSMVLPGSVKDLFRGASNRLYAATTAGFYILDCFDPSRLIPLGAMTDSRFEGVAVQGNFAYLAEYLPGVRQGLRIVNVANPLSPTLAGALTLSNTPSRVELSGTNAFVGVGSDMGGPQGIAVVNVSSPASPSLLTFFDTGLPVHALVLIGATLYAGTGLPAIGYVRSVNVATPSMPADLDSLMLTGPALDLSLDGTTLAVANADSGLVLVDASDPGNLRKIRSLALPQVETRTAALSAGYAYAGLRGYSSTPGSFTVIQTAAPAQALDSTPYSEAVDVATEPGFAFMLLRSGLHIVDVSDPSLPVESGAWEPANATLSCLDAGPGLAAVGEAMTVHLIDTTVPATPTLAGDVAIQSGVAVRPVLDGTTLYVVNGYGNGYEAFDVAIPASPLALGSYAGPGYASDMVVAGTLGYVTSGDALVILDLTAPGSPVMVSSTTFSDQVIGVDVAGTLAVVTGAGSALYTVDVSAASSPTVLYEYTGGLGYDVVLAGQTALVASDEAGVLAFTVTDPLAPTLDGFFDTSGSAVRLAALANTVFLAAEEAQFWVFDCVLCGATSCAASVDIQPPGPITVCEGNTQLLNGSATVVTGCPSSATYQWYEDATPISGAVGPTYTVPATKTAGSYTYTLEASCPAIVNCSDSRDVEVDVVTDTWPTVAYNSVRVSKVPADATLTWSIGTGSGGFNLHSSTVRAEIPALYQNMATQRGSTATTTIQLTDFPTPRQVFYYQVYGQGSCSQNSYN